MELNYGTQRSKHTSIYTVKHAKTENYKILFENVALVQTKVKTVTHMQSTFNNALSEMMIAADIPLCRCGFSNFAGKRLPG